jgi:hypothetical protein
MSVQSIMGAMLSCHAFRHFRKGATLPAGDGVVAASHVHRLCERVDAEEEEQISHHGPEPHQPLNKNRIAPALASATVGRDNWGMGEIIAMALAAESRFGA